MALIGSGNAEKIWNFLVAAGMSKAGAAGVLGNINAESALRPDNLQDTYERSLGMTDAQYVAAVDAGTYKNFAKDCAGFGLCQWTWWTRKQNLKSLALLRNTSIADMETQLLFLLQELQECTSLWKLLISTTNVKTASDAFMLQYENPADQSEAAKIKRADFGAMYLKQFSNTKEPSAKAEQPAVAFKPRLTRPEAGNPYYNTKARGGYSTACKGSPTDAGCDVLHNCVGYAFGRFNEIIDAGACKFLSPVNAENFMQHIGSLKTGMVPRLGACMVWQKGATLDGSDGAGHVAIVEQIVSDTQIVTSESGWASSSPFWTQTRAKGDGNWGQSAAYKFLGFIYNPAPCCQDGSQTLEQMPVHAEASNMPTLCPGNKGATVEAMQALLIGYGYSCGSDGRDGKFGSSTKAALLKYQKDHSLGADAICGPKTWGSLLGL